MSILVCITWQEMCTKQSEIGNMYSQSTETYLFLSTSSLSSVIQHCLIFTQYLTIIKGTNLFSFVKIHWVWETKVISEVESQDTHLTRRPQNEVGRQKCLQPTFEVHHSKSTWHILHIIAQSKCKFFACISLTSRPETPTKSWSLSGNGHK